MPAKEQGRPIASPHKRPRGRAPKGKVWDTETGEWVDEPEEEEPNKNEPEEDEPGKDELMVSYAYPLVVTLTLTLTLILTRRGLHTSDLVAALRKARFGTRRRASGMRRKRATSKNLQQ